MLTIALTLSKWKLQYFLNSHHMALSPRYTYMYVHTHTENLPHCVLA